MARDDLYDAPRPIRDFHPELGEQRLTILTDQHRLSESLIRSDRARKAVLAMPLVLDNRVLYDQAFVGDVEGGAYGAGPGSLVVSPDGLYTTIVGEDNFARVWRVRPPLWGNSEQIRTWVQLVTGSDLAAGGDVTPLSPAELFRRYETLEALGGRPD